MRNTPRFFIAAFFIILLSAKAQAYAFLYQPSPVFLIDRGRLLFTQAGTLTILRLADGRVLKRFDSGPTLRPKRLVIVGGDIMGFAQGQVFRLGRDNCEALWTAELSRATLHGDLVVGESGHNLRAVDLRSGKERWNVSTRYLRFWLRHGDLIFCLGEAEGRTDQLLCVDTRTGEVVWAKKAAKKEEWWKMACSDGLVHVLSHTPESHRQGTFTNIIRTWNQEGEELAPRKPDDQDMRPYLWETDEARFVVDGISHPQDRFGEGEFPAQKNSVRHASAGELARLNIRLAPNTMGFILPDDGLLIGPVAGGQFSPRRYGRESYLPSDRRIHYVDPDRQWSGRPGYMNMGERNPVIWATATGDLVVVASLLGQVECLEKATGRSRWLYLYPAPREDLSTPYPWQYAPWKGGFLVDRLRRYQDGISGKGVTGTVRDGEAAPTRFTIVLDPDARNNYAHLDKQGKLFGRRLILFLSLTLATLALDWWLGRKDGAYRSLLQLLQLTRQGLMLAAGFVALFSAVVLAFVNCGGYSAFTFWYSLFLMAALIGRFSHKFLLQYKNRDNPDFSQTSLLPAGVVLFGLSLFMTSPH